MKNNHTLKETSVNNIYLTYDSEDAPSSLESYDTRSQIDVNCISDYIDYAFYINMKVSQLAEWLHEEFDGRCTLDIEYGDVNRPILNFVIKTPNSKRNYNLNFTCSRIDNETST